MNDFVVRAFSAERGLPDDTYFAVLCNAVVGRIESYSVQLYTFGVPTVPWLSHAHPICVLALVADII